MKKTFIFTLVFCLLISCFLPVTSVSANKPLKVLAIGHSYAVNANEYLWSIAKEMGENIEIHTLYHAGCSIERHVTNYETGRLDYHLYKNGKTDFLLVDMKSVLEAEQYDIVTFQESPEGCTAFGYYKEDLKKLSSYVRNHQPNAEFMIHQTWAFSVETLRGEGDYGAPGYSDSTEHFADIKDAYDQAAELLGGVKIIRCGEAVELAKNAFNFGAAIKDKNSLYADTVSHLSDAGKYLAAAVWAETLTGKDARTTQFVLGIPNADLLLETAHETVSGEQSTVFENVRVLPNNTGYTMLKDYREVGEDGVVTIPTYVDGKLITALDYNLYTGRKDIVEIVIPRSVKSFDSGAFFKYKLTFASPEKLKVPIYKNVWFYLGLGGAVVLIGALILILKKRKKGV